MAIGNVELMHKCFPEHVNSKKEDIETKDVVKMRRVNMERGTAGIKKKKSQWPNCSSGLLYHLESLLSNIVDELHNSLNQHL